MKKHTLLQSLALTLLALASGSVIAKTAIEELKEKVRQRLPLDKAEAHRQAINKKCQLNCKRGEKCCVPPGNGDTYPYCSPVCTAPNQEVK